MGFHNKTKYFIPWNFDWILVNIVVSNAVISLIVGENGMSAEE